MELSAILETIYQDYGVSNSDFPPATVERLVTKALKKLSEYYPFPVLTSMVTVAGQTRYTVTHTGLIKLKKVYYCQGYSPSTDVWKDPDLPQSAQQGLSTYYPSQTHEFIMRMELIKKLNPSDGEIIAHDTFDLIPTPATSGEVVYYEYLRARTIGEVSDLFEEDILGLVVYYAGEKSAQQSILGQAGNRYQFERRGNVTADGVTVKTPQEVRKGQLDILVANIQRKMMSL
jgi:hypothetical protein